MKRTLHSYLKNVPYHKAQKFQGVGKAMRLKLNLGVLVLSNGQIKNVVLSKKKIVDWLKLQYRKYFIAHCKVSLLMKEGMKRCVHLEISRLLSFYLEREKAVKK
jgi:hypothetical protein